MSDTHRYPGEDHRMSQALDILRHALRRLAHSPWLTPVAVLLALGTG
jgi:hypothetical protein